VNQNTIMFVGSTTTGQWKNEPVRVTVLDTDLSTSTMFNFFAEVTFVSLSFYNCKNIRLDATFPKMIDGDLKFVDSTISVDKEVRDRTIVTSKLTLEACEIDEPEHFSLFFYQVFMYKGPVPNFPLHARFYVGVPLKGTEAYAMLRSYPDVEAVKLGPICEVEASDLIRLYKERPNVGIRQWSSEMLHGVYPEVKEFIKKELGNHMGMIYTKHVYKQITPEIYTVTMPISHFTTMGMIDEIARIDNPLESTCKPTQ